MFLRLHIVRQIRSQNGPRLSQPQQPRRYPGFRASTTIGNAAAGTAAVLKSHSQNETTLGDVAMILKPLLFSLALFLLTTSGCTTSSTAKAQARAAFLAGQQQAHMQQQQGPVVTVLGQVRNRMIPWTEELALSQVLIAADYQGFLDPRAIVIVRKGRRFQVNVKHLLRGTEDPLVEPGDTIEIQ